MSHLHEGWPTVLIRLQRSGLLRGLGADEAEHLLCADGRRAPTSLGIAGLLRRWYAADGDWIEALWRRQADAYVEVYAHQDPRQVALSVVHSQPSLEGLSATATDEAMIVSLEDDRVTLSRVMRHARRPDRQRRRAVLAPEHVIRGVNVLLSRRDAPMRFVELRAEPERRAFTAVSQRAAGELLGLGVTRHRELGGLRDAASWEAPRSTRAAG
ncbi:MAG TPA: hypothetical protein RMH99_19230 [Sandaracinaceae bacterium LLY-WYZ-13_1]|nr:hypothetical protein [Sandaracinaceae bacterium LLY-WYZ-13_1]